MTVKIRDMLGLEYIDWNIVKVYDISATYLYLKSIRGPLEIELPKNIFSDWSNSKKIIFYGNGDYNE